MDRMDWFWLVVGSVAVAVDMKVGLSVWMDCGTGRQADGGVSNRRDNTALGKIGIT